MRGQLTLTVPSRKIQTSRMSPRQRQAWRTLRGLDSVTVSEFARWTGFEKDPHGAIQRLLRRGLIVRVARGTYKAFTPGERKR